MEDLYNSVNQYFPNDQCIMSHNCPCAKDSFKAPERPMDFNVMKFEKFIAVSRVHITNNLGHLFLKTFLSCKINIQHCFHVIVD